MGYRRNRHAAEDDMVRSVPDWVLFKRMVGYIVAQRKESLTLVLAITVASIINLIPPYLATLAIDRYIIVNDPEGLTVLSVILIVTYALIFTSRYVQRFLISWLGAQLDRNMRQDIFSHLQRLSLTFYAKREVGSIVSRATNDIDKITELITSGVANVVADILTLVGIIIIMLSMNWWLSLITFSIIPLMLIFLYIWGRRVRKVYRETRKTIASVSAKMEESVSGMKEI
ncbi:hypothetical protein HN588_13545, partial [Candidatus Bathyarchaeota archaeon]|nr:hypothetical protein [Candidatus Bathyarchaeota archaeon]